MPQRQHYPYILLLFLATAVFFILNLWTPLYSDDWDHQIHAWSELPQSLCFNYLHVTGRMVPHLFAHSFSDLIGKPIFNLVNTLVFALFLWQLTHYFVPRRQYRLTALIVVLFVLFFIQWGFKFSFLWMSGACNYLWVGVMLMMFHHTLAPRPTLLALLLAFLCGLTNEGMVLGLAIGYLVCHLTNPNPTKLKNLKTQKLKNSLLFFWAGTLLLLCSPGNFDRALHDDLGGGMFWVFNLSRLNLTLTNVLHIYGLWFTVAIALLLHFTGIKPLRTTLKENQLWTIAILVSLLFSIALGIINERSCFGIELFSLIILLRILPYDLMGVKGELWGSYEGVKGKLKGSYGGVKGTNLGGNVVKGVLLVCVVAVWCIVLPAAYANHQENEQTLQQVEATTDGIVMVTPKPDTWIQQKYLLWVGSGTPHWYLQYDADIWPVPLICQHYHKPRLCFLPHSFVHDARSRRVPSTFSKAYWPLYVKKLGRHAPSPHAVSLIMRPAHADDIPWYHRLFAHRLARYTQLELPHIRFCIVTIGEDRYVMATLDDMLDPRVIDMKFY